MSQTVEVERVLIVAAVIAGVLFAPLSAASAWLWKKSKSDDYVYASGSTVKFLREGFIIYCKGRPEWMPFRHRPGVGNVVKNYRDMFCSE
jgi:hypothetical protein